MKGLMLVAIWILGMHVVGDNLVSGYDRFSYNARQWADSVYHTLDLELRVAQILASNQPEMAKVLPKQIPPPGFIISESGFSEIKSKDPKFPLATFIVPDLKNGFQSENSWLPFPDESSLVVMDSKHQNQLRELLKSKLYSNGQPAFVASGNFSSDWMNGYIIGSDNYSPRDVLWMPFVSENVSDVPLGLRLFMMPRQIISLIPSRLPDISYKANTHKVPVISVERWRKEPVTEVAIEQVLKDGMVLVTDNYEYDYRRLLSAFKDRWLPASLLEKNCRMVLAYKYDAIMRMSEGNVNITSDKEELILRQAYENTIMLFQGKSNAPFPLQELNIQVGFYDNTQGNSEYFREMASNYLSIFPELAGETKYDLVFWLIDSFCDLPASIEDFVTQIKRNYRGANVVIVYAGDLSKVPFDRLPRYLDAFLVAPANIPYVWNALAQGAFGGVEITQKHDKNFFDSDLLKIQRAIKPSRFKYGTALEAGLDLDILKQVDQLIESAIRKQATPGAQLLVVRNGVVAWHKSYGFHTYEKYDPVKNSDLYDLASITKVSATLPTLMKLYDEGRWRLADPLGSFIPEADTTDKRAITMRQLLLHESGLPAFIPFHISTIDRQKLVGDLYSRRRSATHSLQVDERLWMNRTAVLRDDLYRNVPDLRFSVPVARDLYLERSYTDSVFLQILDTRLNSNAYRYSDLNFLLLQRIAENLTSTSIDHYMAEHFFIPMGASSLTFNPWVKMPVTNVVPTENDMAFRRQLLRGYVHDQTAALMGGVAGHAGLFGNANDLGKMMQMYLNGGVYGYRRYLNSETINFFSARQNNTSRRGIGFDKPEPDPDKVSPAGKLASPLSFGHSGFSGTIAWADPEYDLVYVFLSNRIHPNQYNRLLIQENIRTKLQDIIYKSVLKD